MAAPPEPTSERDERSPLPDTAKAAVRQVASAAEDVSAFDPASQSAVQSAVQSSVQSAQEPPLQVDGSAPTPVRPDYSNDSSSGADRLGIGREVDALAYLIAARDVVPPLSIGLFGDWGSGKSFFMDQLRRRVDQLAKAPVDAPRISPFYKNIIQIDFNAWHYIEANLWASLAIRVFEGLAGELAEKNADMDQLRRKLLETVKLSHANLIAAEALKVAALQQLQAARAAKSRAVRDLQESVGSLTDNARNAQAAVDAFLGGDAGGSENLTVEKLKKVAGLRDLPALVTLSWKRVRALRVAQVALWLVVALVPLAVGVAWALTGAKLGPDSLRALAGLIGVVVALGALVRNVTSAAGSLADAAEADDHVKTALEKHHNESDNARRAQSDLASAERTLGALERQMPEVYRFVQERYSSLEYQKALGIVALVQRDFQNLSRLLHEPDGDGKPPQVERIVLYIDDLDRCPPELVVKVLQAVHLLLAFPLFVVVVGVDSRWLLESLQTVQRAASHTANAGRSDGALDAGSSETTPQSYLEKIFQIPFWIRPMTPGGYKRLVRSLTLPSAEPDAPENLVPPAAIPEIKPLDPLETTSLELFGPLIPTPRAAKRLINTYRLLRAFLASQDIYAFIGNEVAPGEHRAVMLLLAIIAGFPQLSGEVFKRLEEATDESWSSFEALLPAGDEGWRELRDALKEVSSGDARPMDRPDGLDAYKKWAPVVARYSFEAGRLIPTLERDSEGQTDGQAGNSQMARPAS